MNFRFHTRSTTTESLDSVSSVTGWPTRGRPVAAVRWRRPCLSAPTPSLGRHDATPSLGHPHFASLELLLSSISPRRAPPRNSSLARASLAMSGQASLPNASPKLPLPQRHLLGHCRARVRRHCRAPGIGWARRCIARSTAEPPFTPASPLELGRVRVSHLGKSALVRGSRWCPRFPRRPRHHRASPATSVSPVSVSLSHGSHVSADPTCQPLTLTSLVHCVADPLLFLKNSYLEFYRSKWCGSNFARFLW